MEVKPPTTKSWLPTTALACDLTPVGMFGASDQAVVGAGIGTPVGVAPMTGCKTSMVIHDPICRVLVEVVLDACGWRIAHSGDCPANPRPPPA